ncbi:unnamed protein product [Heligmosomoides polygyrus]|uniref:Protein kinase domain-containing protein n=1 Tax=Heligmosomoides polygyrus TaxID=6339 RepID=A0A3P8A1I0_HELPZ|nr:unnamed protein product [Heligmosomoides polygyrus]
MDQKFHGAFIRDILSGLEYIHASAIGSHGALSPWACLIDRNWMIKLTDYGKLRRRALEEGKAKIFVVGVADALERWEKQQAVSVDALKDSDDKTQALQATSGVMFFYPKSSCS